MLDQLKRFFNAVEKEPEMVQETLQAPVLADNTAELASVQAALASQAEAFTTVTEQLAELTKKYDEAQAKLSAIEEDKASLLAKAAEVKAQARKEKVEATLGTAKAEGVLAATASLNDEAFEAVVSAFAASYDAEANSKAFKEVGMSAKEGEAPKQAHFKDYIKTNKD